MDPAEFNDVYHHDVLEKLSNKYKTLVLMGNFNIDLLKYDSNIDLSTFLDKMYSSFLLPYILSPSRLTIRSQMLIDNIFSNNIEKDINSGNLTSTISDHYAQFLLFENTKPLPPKKDPAIENLQQSFKCMNEEKFRSELNSLDLPNVLHIGNDNVDLSFDLFLDNVDKLILKHAPLKKLTIQEKKLRLKPGITTGILLTSIKTKNRIYRKFLCTKNATTKQQLHDHFKYY